MHVRGLAVLGAAVAGLSGTVNAQIRASAHGVAAQTVDGTTITIEYFRPQVRDRDPIFGGAVHWGEVWTPGANWATTVEVDKGIELNGNAVPAGKYSLWMIVQPDEWTVVLDPTSRLFHTNRPDSSDAQIRFTVVPEEWPHQEILTFSFPEVSATGGTIALHWATTYVPLSFTVETSLDGKTWEMVADRRDNRELSTAKGYACGFDPHPARYIRVTQTHCSANPGRHLVEVMAYEN